MKVTFISIIIPTFDDWPRLRLCLQALRFQTYPTNAFEVIVVNNNPLDDVPEQFEGDDNVIFLREKEPGSYAARNKALKIAKGNIIGFTDSDTIPDQEWISNAVEYFENHKDIFRIGGSIKIFYKTESPTYVELYDTVFAFRQKEYVEQLGFGVTANMFAYKILFNEIGEFNGDLLSGGDFEWGKRAGSNGYSIHYVESVIVLHPARSTYGELKRKTKRVSGGHLRQRSGGTKLNQLMISLIKGFKPNITDIRYIHSSDKISTIEKIIVFGIRYHLGFLSNLEKIKISLGNKPERQ